MQNLIKEIVEMDRKAQEITDAAQQRKVDSEKEVAERREQIRTEYLTKARERILMNEPKERQLADAAWKAVEERHKAVSQQLDDLYEKRGGEWVKSIVANVIGE